MIKSFFPWHNKKECIDRKNKRIYFHEREIWWCSIGVNVGFEQDGKGKDFARPVLIFKKFNKEIFWALPLSTIIKSNKFYYPLNLGDNINRCVILSQIRLLDGKRLLDKAGIINNETYKNIQKAVINLCSS